LEKYFGQGPRVIAPLREGTPINAVLQRRERSLDHNEGGRGESNLTSNKATKKTKSKKQHQTADTGEVQDAKKRATQKSKQKLNSQGSDDKTSLRSK
jgi:hypothetical protein